MSSKCASSLFFLIFSFIIKGQTDSVKCGEGFQIKEGIYLSYSDLRNNTTVSRDEIITGISKDQLDFFGKITAEKTFTYSSSGSKKTVESKNAWGYYQNNTLHINYNGEFFRVPLFGSISFFVATVEVVSPAYYTPGYGGMMGNTVKTKELRNFLMNFYDGIIVPFSTEEAERLISRDSLLYKEFKALKRKQQKEQISRYIRKYNELHPVYFIKRSD